MLHTLTVFPIRSDGFLLSRLMNFIAGLGNNEIIIFVTAGSTGIAECCTELLSHTAEFKKVFRAPPVAKILLIFIACPLLNIFIQASSVKSMKFINISPLPFIEHEVACGKEGHPLLKFCWGGVSAMSSSPQFASPHKCFKPSQ